MRNVSWAGKRPMPVSSGFDPHPLAFVAVCRRAGVLDAALAPVSVGEIPTGDQKGKRPGARRFDVEALAGLAQRLLGDDAPMTPERWRRAGQAAVAAERERTG